ncbi:pilus assembly protein N-terminal domain-containing protein [Pseudomonas sp. PDM14]|uniref:type II and III secretion system protein family protein n=1 Tax=Pseudomonas sp. PDM14 TaxID=2769288 RepID=UPI0017801640|nr:pilus assembly protein N-terminal domain-containing protein [Pseudomonas sp. PDM14]MBD9482221.1 pilus assembly protein N-terminal domain-containing protein [Pseudomonas sp. PDM14]
MRFVVGILAILSLSLSAQANTLPTSLVLYDGDVRVLSAPGVERVAVGNVDLISATLLKNEEVVLTAQQDGETTVHFWFEDGSREQMSVVVAKGNGYRQLPELRAMLSGIPGVRLRTVGRQVVVDGRVSAEQLVQIKDAVKPYGDNVIVLAEEQTGAATKSDAAEVLSEVQAMLGQIPGITIRAVGRQIVVDGSLDQVDLNRIELVKKSYPDVLVLAQLTSEYDAPMVYFDVRITEFAKDDVEELGVNWSTSINGPTLAFNADGGTNNLYRGQFPSASGTFDNLNDVVGDAGSHAYWGIASELTSRINLLEKNGSALTLASPRLSARSGGKAQLTVGGEVPVVTSSISGPSVEYKDFGIMLNIEPKLYGSDQVATKVQAEISQLDKANQVGEYPAFKTRRTENDVQLRIGETLVLSGLVTEDSQTSHEGLVWLKDLPFLGTLFRNKSFKGSRTELVIFITPRLLTDAPDSVNAEEINRQKKMIERYRRDVDAIELID